MTPLSPRLGWLVAGLSSLAISAGAHCAEALTRVLSSLMFRNHSELSAVTHALVEVVRACPAWALSLVAAAPLAALAWRHSRFLLATCASLLALSVVHVGFTAWAFAENLAPCGDVRQPLPPANPTPEVLVAFLARKGCHE